MTGTVFTDGSGLHGKEGPLRRAGWSVVQVNRFGVPVHAAYGPVPEPEAPGQVARDGEDFALMMLSQVAEPPLRVYTDCQGTKGCFLEPKSASTGSGNPRAHLWTRFWAAFEGEQVEVFKTKGHATSTDVEMGRSTWWEREANQAADTYAKKGAECHGLDPQARWQWVALRDIVAQAARWAGQQEAIMAGLEHKDAQALQSGEAGADIGRLEVGRVASARPCYVRAWPEDQDPTKVLGHKLQVATTSLGGTLLCCVSCGAYAWRRTKALMSKCLGSAAGDGLRLQRRKLALGYFPGGEMGRATIGQLRTPSAAAVRWLMDCIGSRQGEAPCLLEDFTTERGVTPWRPEEVLAAYGLDQTTLELHVVRIKRLAQQKRAGRARPDPGQRDWDSGSDDQWC